MENRQTDSRARTWCIRAVAIWVGVLALALDATPVRASDEDPYTRVTKQAADLERAGEHAGAAARLETIASRYPQDYALQLQLGWLHFRAGHHQRAEQGYRRALALTPTSQEARLGLAWALLKQGDRTAARPHFQTVLGQASSNASARQGLALSQELPLLRVDPAFGTSFHAYQSHPSRRWGIAWTLSLPLTIRQQWLLAASYRYQHLMVVNAQGTRGGRGLVGLGQHEVYLSAGLIRPKLGLVGQYAYLDDGSGFTPRVQVVGLSARYSPWGDLLLAANVSLYEDLTVARVAPAWRIPLRPWLQLIPGLALQVATSDQPNDQLDEATEVLVTGSLTLRLLGAAGSLWIGGKLGDEVRPADLDLLAVTNIPERVLFGAWVGASLRVGGGWSLQVAYLLERFEARPVGAYADSNLHLVAAGVSWSAGQGASNRR